MPSPKPLQQLHDLDRSSPEFHNQLIDILLGEDNDENLVQYLPHEDARPFVEYLDNALNNLKPTCGTFCPRLFELRRICGAYKVLPRSHVLPEDSLDINDHPITSGTLTDTHRGTLRGSQVCVKRLRVYSKEDPQKVKMFYQEAVVWKRMDHPNIAPFRGVTLDPPQLVSDWMPAGDISEYINKRPDVNLLGLLCDAAGGLSYLHYCNVVHGNMKGANILVDDCGRARITDFALTESSCSQGSTPHVTKMHDYNTRWTAPEVLEETMPLTKEADVFSFGMVMVEVFTGVVPFNHFQSVASMIKIIQGERPPRPTNSALTDDVWALMEMCWEQEPQSRPVMREVLQVLAPSLLRSLYQSTKSSPEFEVALGQFYGSIERKECVSRLRGADVKEFANFLEDVLRTKGINELLTRQTLQNLQEVFEDLTVYPRSHVIHLQFSKLPANPHAASKYVQLWKGQLNFGEAGDRPLDAYLKVAKLEKVYEGFYEKVVAWTKLDHPNVLRCFGVTVDPFQMLTEWMPNGQVMNHVEVQNGVDRVRLLIEIAQGLDYLHSNGVVHGNLKQQNILVDSAGHACLSDIGFATLAPSNGSQFDWANVGADGYRWAAPEIFKTGILSKQSDMFSYGFIAAEIFTGEYIWEKIDARGVRPKIAGGERPCRSEDEKKPTLTAKWLWRIFAKCWGTEPKTRISASELLGILPYLPQPNSGISYNFEKVATQEQTQTGQERIDELDKMLETNMIISRERPRFLNQLCKMCGHERALPGSMIVPSLARLSTVPMCGGGSADVYQGKYKGRLVAIKVVRLYDCNDRDVDRSRFCREAVAWRHLQHPNVLPLLSATLEPNEFTLVSEWMSNGNINHFIQKHPKVNRIQLLVDVAHGLEYLHDLNFVHGDLKGANILIKNNHRACLADFGLSTIVYVAPCIAPDVSTSSVASKASVDSKVSVVPHRSGGTIFWMSPELLYPKKFKLEHHKLTKQSDCYALGMVIYEVLCGEMPYWDHGGNVMKAILDGIRPSKPSEAATLGFTDELWWIVECCWMADRGIRPDVKTVLSHLTHAAWVWERGQSDHWEVSC